VLNQHLSEHAFFVDDRYTIADIALYGYVHVAPEAGFDLSPYAAVRTWLQHVREQPGFMEDVEPYPANSVAGASRSIYD
jgi:glutathione S-transferase